MSDTIYAKLTEDFIRRMRNWVKARDMAVTPSSWPGPHNIYGRCDGSGYMETPLPLLCGEAQDTEAAIRQIPGRYRQAVTQFWSYEGQSLRRHAIRRGLHHETFEAWVIRGHEALKGALAKRTAYNQARAAIARAAGAGA